MNPQHPPQKVAQQQAPQHELSITDQIHEIKRDRMGPDELYDLRRELMEMGETNLAVRVDIEYGNSLRYDDYRPKFTASNLVTIAMFLGNVEYSHIMQGNRQRAQLVSNIADTISDHFRDWADEHDVDLSQYLGIEIGGGDDSDNVTRDHSERMESAKHDQDVEVEVSGDVDFGPDNDTGIEPTDVEEKPVDFGPDDVEEEQLMQKPQEPDQPGNAGDEPDNDPEGA